MNPKVKQLIQFGWFSFFISFSLEKTVKSLCKTKKSLHKTATTKARADNEDMGEMASSIIASSHHPLLHVDQGLDLHATMDGVKRQW